MYGTIGSKVEDGFLGMDLAIQDNQRHGNVRSIPRRLFTMFMLFILVSIFLIFYSSNADLCVGLLNPPFQLRHFSDFKNRTFSVGFDLTAGYGTAAVAFSNGTIVNVGRVKGTPEYNDLLARLSLESSAYPTPPYYNCTAQSADLPRQWRRYLNRRLGYPASSDVAVFADVLDKLKSQTNSFLGSLGPLELAFITVPYLPALYLEDLVDAGEYVNVPLLTLPWYIYQSGDAAQWPVFEISSAFAGNGFGIGDLVSSNSSVLKEPWSDNVFSVLFTETALTAHIAPLSSALHFFGSTGIANFSLGLDQSLSVPHFLSSSKLSSTASPSSSSYWLQVRLALREALNTYYRAHQLGRVVSSGESAHNEIFDSILKQEVLRFQWSDDPDKQPVFSSIDPVFAAAKGAALFGKFCSKMQRPDDCFPNLTPRMQGW